MAKINETLNLVQSGARSNKYRIMMDFFDPRDIDILCHTASQPGSSIGTVETIIKGRKVQLPGDVSDDGTWTMTIYNTENFEVRRFFLRVLHGIQNFNAPVAPGDMPAVESLFRNATAASSSVSGSNSASGVGTSGSGSGLGGIFSDVGNALGKVDDFIGKVSKIKNKIDTAYKNIKGEIQNIKNIGNKVSTFFGKASKGPKGFLDAVDYYNGGMKMNSISGYKPYYWYMKDITIQQLNHNGETTFTTVLHDAYITEVSEVEYDDSAEGISVTTLTFAYNSFSIGDDYGDAVIERF